MDQEAYPSSLRYFSLLCSTIFNRLKPASTDDVPNGRGGGNVARGEGRLGQQDPAQGRQAHMGVAGTWVLLVDLFGDGSHAHMGVAGGDLFGDGDLLLRLSGMHLPYFDGLFIHVFIIFFCWKNYW